MHELLCGTSDYRQAFAASRHGANAHHLFRSRRAKVNDADDWTRINTLLKRWGFIVQTFAKNLGAKADSVFDLDRILRVPDTVNNKFSADAIPVVCYANGGRALSSDSAYLRVNARGIGVSEIPAPGCYGIDSESSDSGAANSNPKIVASRVAK
jgi:hypothetical protein